jgi:hypothetical protein
MAALPSPAVARSDGANVQCREPAHLLFEDLLNLADFLLDFAGKLFVLTFGLELDVVRHLSRCLFNFTFYFVKLALISSFVLSFICLVPLSAISRLASAATWETEFIALPVRM